MRPVKYLFAVLAVALIAFPLHVHAATLTGNVKFDGDIPKLKPINMQADPICLSKHSKEALPQTLLLGPNKELANVFVYVKKGLPAQKFPVPAQEIVVDQEGCEYIPHVVGVMVGQTMKILNPDGTLHNVHALTKVNEEFNLAMPKFRKETTVTFTKPEFMFPMKCDVHPWMGAWVAVLEHPFFSVSQTDGKFQIANLPAGTYELEAWHEKMGTQTASVTVTGDESQEVNFTFAPPKKADKEAGAETK